MSGLDELGICAKQAVGSPPLADTQPCRGALSCSEELMEDSDMVWSQIWKDARIKLLIFFYFKHYNCRNRAVLQGESLAVGSASPAGAAILRGCLQHCLVLSVACRQGARRSHPLADATRWAELSIYTISFKEGSLGTKHSAML